MDDLRANPAPLGLMGFGMTTVLLSLYNAEFFAMDDVVIAMGLCYGGLAQLIAGVMAFRRADTFSTTAFTSYGLFWLSLVYILLADKTTTLSFGSDSAFMGWYFALWAVFTAAMIVGALHRSLALQVVLISLTAVFTLLAAGEFLENGVVTEVAGYAGLLCGASAIYLAAAETISDALGRVVLPVGAYQGPRRRRTWIDEMPPLEPTVPHPFDDNLPEFED